jgi:ribonuclease inhibitor
LATLKFRYPVLRSISFEGQEMDRVPVVDIDLSSVTTAGELHGRLRDALGFPDWYGCNWDAFWDAITGLVDLPEQLRITGWPVLSQRLPEDARLMKKCLAEMNTQYPEMATQVLFD